MIGRVLNRSIDHAGLLRYLYGPGRGCIHSSPHLVGATCCDPGRQAFQPVRE
jgi:hypothetical protein